MLPLVDIVRSSGLLADKTVDTVLTSITDVFNFYGRDLAAISGHDLIIEETGRGLNHDRQGFQKAVIQTSDREDRFRHIADAQMFTPLTHLGDIYPVWVMCHVLHVVSVSGR